MPPTRSSSSSARASTSLASSMDVKPTRGIASKLAPRPTTSKRVGLPSPSSSSARDESTITLEPKRTIKAPVTPRFARRVKAEPKLAAKRTSVASTSIKNTRLSSVSSVDAPRTTRRWGKPAFFNEIEGAPQGQAKKGGNAKRKVAEVQSDGDDEDVVVSVAKRGRPATKTKKTQRPISPEPASDEEEEEEDSSGSDDDEVVEKGLKSRAAAVKSLPTPTSTPNKRSRTTTSTTPASSPSKGSAKARGKMTPTRPAQRRTREPSPSRSSRAGSTTSLLVDEGDESSEDEMTLQPTKTPSPKKNLNQNRLLGSSSSSRRSSARAQLLPISQADIAATPSNLRSRLVGFHQEDEGYGVSPTTADKGKGRAVSEEIEVEQAAMLDDATTSNEGRRLYSASSLSSLYSSIGSVLNGWTLPSPMTPAQPFDTTDVMAHPFLEGDYKEWERPIRYAMKGVVKDGVGNCLIMLGPRGVGKTMLVERTMALLEQTYGKDSFIPVRLNGLVHTTDRQALRAIARQLKSQGYEEEGGDWNSNAATMTTLLRMLEPANDPSALAHKPIVILVDEFDLFAQHPRQSFLYCLLDIVQGNRRKAGMGVVGLSARSDCLSILEKRVRSRCQSQVHQMVLDNDFDKYKALAERLLKVDVIAWESKGSADGELAKEWNEEVESFLANEKVVAYLNRSWSINGNTPTQLRATLSSLCSKLEWQTKHSTASLLSPPPSTLAVPRLTPAMLPREPFASGREDLPFAHLTILEWTVLIAAKHLRGTHDTSLNLELLYRAYLEHVARGKMSGVASKPFPRLAFCMAFDSLRSHELLIPSRHSASTSTHYLTPSQGDAYASFKLVPWDKTIDRELQKRIETKKDVSPDLSRWCKQAHG